MTSGDANLDAVDLFCGMGGSSTGLVEAGFKVRVAANHWARAIETHSANHPDTEHLCADIQAVDLRYLPRTRLLWASPICTEVSPAGGKKRRRAEMDLFEEYGHVPDAAFERTRVTFWEVLRAAEIHKQDAILIENVVEAFDWQLMPVFLDGLERLGYQWQVVSVSAAHVGDEVNAFAPQWRDRIYIQALPKGVHMPKLEPRPQAFCGACDHVVEAVQQWKPINGRRAKLWYRELPVGKYGQQYIYACPVPTHGRVEPFVLPAAAAIDWSDLGTRIGDRKRPLSPATMRRIEAGARMIASGEFSFSRVWEGAESAGSSEAAALMVAAAGQTYDAASGKPGSYLRVWPVDGSPMATATTTSELGVTFPPGFISKHHGGLDYRAIEHMNKGLDEPLPGFVTRPNLSLVTPPREGRFVMSVNHDGDGRHFDPAARPLPSETVKQGQALVVDEAFVAMLRNHGRATPAGEPLATFTGGGFHHALVVPYRKGAVPYPVEEGPLSTAATHAQHGVLNGAEDIPVTDYHFRMLKPREAANAQRFPPSYIIQGNQGEQQMQAGNAVPVNVAHWLGRATAAALDGDASVSHEVIGNDSHSRGAAQQRRGGDQPGVGRAVDGRRR
ncbi:DNA cytosine methyltransferase [Propioniciclava soli]|uniref:DNA cytosine methyltransferase n=1 Tax=Propioniciclava soli TaxID=2775081 RepID=UPI001E3636AC|nr:DNA cytosine methyltransferase [Propioniciclava soli]